MSLPASLRRAAPTGFPDLTPLPLAWDVQRRQRLGAGGSAGPRGPAGLNYAQRRLQSFAKLRRALCKVQPECLDLRARWVSSLPGQTAGSGGAWPGIPGTRDRGPAHSLRTGVAGPRAGPPPPPGRPRACWPTALRVVAEAARRTGWGLSGWPWVSTTLGSCWGGHAAPPSPPPTSQPAPLAGSRAQGVSWRDPWGRGAARRRPEGKASRARGDFPRPPRSCPAPSAGAATELRDRPVGTREAVRGS